MMAASVRSGRLVLVVDSDLDFVEDARLVLRGERVLTARSVDEAYEIALGGRADVAILGPSFGTTEGIGRGVELLEADPGLSIVLATNVVTNRILKEALRSGLADVVETPLTMRRVGEVLAQFERTQRMRRAAEPQPTPWPRPIVDNVPVPGAAADLTPVTAKPSESDPGVPFEATEAAEAVPSVEEFTPMTEPVGESTGDTWLFIGPGGVTPVTRQEPAPVVHQPTPSLPVVLEPTPVVPSPVVPVHAPAMDQSLPPVPPAPSSHPAVTPDRGVMVEAIPIEPPVVTAAVPSPLPSLPAVAGGGVPTGVPPGSWVYPEAEVVVEPQQYPMTPPAEDFAATPLPPVPVVDDSVDIDLLPPKPAPLPPQITEVAPGETLTVAPSTPQAPFTPLPLSAPPPLVVSPTPSVDRGSDFDPDPPGGGLPTPPPPPPGMMPEPAAPPPLSPPMPIPVPAPEPAAVFTGAVNAEPVSDPVSHHTGGRVITVMAGKGGSGKTVTAVNLATALTFAEGPDMVVAVDADLQFGDVALLLQLEPTTTIVDVAAAIDTLSDPQLDGLLLRHESGLRVLPAPLLPTMAGSIAAQSIVSVIERLRGLYSRVVVDTAPIFDQMLVTLLDHSDDVVLVVDMDLPSVKNAKIALDGLRGAGYPIERIRLVVNRVNSKARLDIVELERSLGIPVVGSIPSDRLLPQSVNEGIPAVAFSPRSRVAKSFTDLAELFLAREPERAAG